MRFDWVISGCRRGSDKACDIDLSSSEYAATVPSIGSIVPNWLLVVPRVHSLNYNQLNKSYRLNILDMCKKITSNLEKAYKHVTVFEHGASSEGSITGCGVDQAHLHIVPSEFEFADLALSDLLIDWREADLCDPWACIEENKEYYLIVTKGSAYIGYPMEKTSQYMRRCIATAAGVPDKWDYREFPFYENVELTHLYSAKGMIQQAA